MKLVPIALTFALAAGMLMPPCFALDPAWQAFNDGAEAQFKAKNYFDAEVLFLKAKTQAVSMGEKTELAKTLSDMGWMYDNLKRYGDAEKVYTELLAVRKVLFGDNSLEVARAYRLIGNEQVNQGKLPLGEANYLLALNILDALIGNSNPAPDADTKELIGLLRNLVTVCQLEHKDADAQAYQTRVASVGLGYVNATGHH